MFASIAMEEPVRVRVIFDDHKMLSKSQRSEGLKRCWLLLNPGIATISDLESLVRRSFNLKDSCPHGLVLSMDDFVLPPFESTCVLKDKDIIRVRMKDAPHLGVIDLGDDPSYIQDLGDVEKQYTVCSDKLLAIREFGEDSGHKRKNDEDLRVYNDNAIETGTPLKSKKKRKHSDGIKDSREKKLKISSKMPKITAAEAEDTDEADEGIHLGKSLESSQEGGNIHKHSSKKDKQSILEGIQNISSQLEDNVEQVTSSDQKERRRKKSRLVSPEKAMVTIHEVENIPIKQNQSSCQTRDNYVNQKDKQSDEDGTSGAVIASQPDDNVNEKSSSMLMEQRNVQAEENVEGITCEKHDGSMAKVQSRNARRKKLKRQWLRELKSKGDQNTQSQISPNAIHKESTEQQEVDQNTELEKKVIPVVSQQQEAEQNTEMEMEFVPVVIRPGHIRFQPIDEEKSQWQSHETIETLHWNGTANKKKGQKWGREKTVGNWNDANGYKQQSNEKEKHMSKWNDANGYKGQKWDNEKSMRKWNDANSYKGQKFARDKTTSKWNDSNGYKEQSYSKQKTVSKWNDVNGCTEQPNGKASNWNEANGYKEQCNKNLSGKGQAGSSEIDFESLFPLTRIPQVGDVLAYRLIELSSSWCPEVSSFRVGQVTSYNYMSLSIILVPVPEYPIFSDEDIERRDTMLQANSSPYNEDGSLQIHYPSLVDVRLLKGSDSEATASDNPGRELSSTREAAPVNNWELAVVQTNTNSSVTQMITQETAPVNNWEVAVVNSKAEGTVVQPTANGDAGGSTWDQIKQAVTEKKAQLQKKGGWDEWTPSKSTASTAWSYRALRRSAVGPTLAYLRGRNDKRPRGK